MSLSFLYRTEWKYVRLRISVQYCPVSPLKNCPKRTRGFLISNTPRAVSLPTCGSPVEQIM